METGETIKHINLDLGRRAGNRENPQSGLGILQFQVNGDNRFLPAVAMRSGDPLRSLFDRAHRRKIESLITPPVSPDGVGEKEEEQNQRLAKAPVFPHRRDCPYWTPS